MMEPDRRPPSDTECELLRADNEHLERALQAATSLLLTTIQQVESLERSVTWRCVKTLQRMASWLPQTFRATAGHAFRFAFRQIPPRARLQVFGSFAGTLNKLDPYQLWQMLHERRMSRSAAEQLVAQFTWLPKISIVCPTYNSDPVHLRAMLESVVQQLYPYWELCLVDDGSPQTAHLPVIEEFAARDSRIQVRYASQNQGIAAATNAALEMANGDYVAFVDHDDVLASRALLEVARALNRDSSWDLIYSDEDNLDPKGQRCSPRFKPDFSPQYLLGNNYICHLCVCRRSIVTELGGIRTGFEGAQDHDFLLRFTERTQRVLHLPQILYHWRMSPTSTASSSDNKPLAGQAGVAAVTAALTRRGHCVEQVQPLRICPTAYVPRWRLPAQPPIRILIPTKNNRKLLSQCLDSIAKHTTYKNYRVLVIDNGSTQPATKAYLQQVHGKSKVEVVTYDVPFNHSQINNWAVEQTSEEHLLLLNDDVEVISGDWLERMLQYLEPDVGAVGPRLLYPTGRLQHGGVVLGLGGVAGHLHIGSEPAHFEQLFDQTLSREVSAVTGACLLTTRNVYQQVGGLDAANLRTSFNDVDFCLKIRALGRRIICTPQAVLYHHESASRGRENDGAAIAFMEQRWSRELAADPYYNVNLTRQRYDGTLSWNRAASKAA